MLYLQINQIKCNISFLSLFISLISFNLINLKYKQCSTEKEVLRRRDLLSKLRIQKEDIERRIKNPRQNTGTRFLFFFLFFFSFSLSFFFFSKFDLNF